MKILDQSTWNRKEHFDFFSSCDEPYFGLVTEINCTKAYRYAKENNLSFFAYYLHNSLRAVNQVEELRYRIVDDEVLVYKEIHASPTLGREDHTFGFSFVPFHNEFETFQASLKKEIAAVQNSIGLRLTDDANKKNVVHYSSIPWNTFSGLSHARNFKIKDSAPKISFGRLFQRGKDYIMNVSIHVHHGLADGYHVGKHLEYFQQFMDGNNLRNKNNKFFK